MCYQNKKNNRGGKIKILRFWIFAGAVFAVLVTGLVTSSGVFASTTSEMFRTRAVLAMYSGKHQEALEQLNKATKDDPEDYTSLFYRGIVYTRLGEYQLAIKDIELATKSGVQMEGLHFELGYAYYLNENLDQARVSLEKAHLDYPQHAPAKYYYGLVLFQQGLYEQSIKPLNEAVVLDPTFGPSSAYLSADAYVKMNRIKEARKVLTQALIDYPDSVYYNATRQLLEKISSKKQKAKRYSAKVEAGFAHDSNVGLFPDDKPLPENKTAADSRSFFNLGAKYKIYSAQKQWLRIGYQYFTSKHAELSEYDLDRHIALIELRDRRESFTWGVSYAFAKTGLDGRNFMESSTIVPNFLLPHGGNNFSLLTLQVRDSDYLLQGLEDRSSYFYELLYRFYYVDEGSAKRKIFAGFKLHQENTADDEFDYNGYALEFGFDQKLFGGDFNSAISYGARDYTESVISRKNESAKINFKYIYPLLESFELEGALTYVDNPSNDPIYDYSRSVFSALLRWKI